MSDKRRRVTGLIVTVTGVLVGAGVGLALTDLPTSFALVIFGGLLVGMYVSAQRTVKLGRAAGRLQGRVDLYESLLEAEQRGMTRNEWLTAELERDRIYFYEHVMSRRAKRILEKRKTKENVE